MTDGRTLTVLLASSTGEYLEKIIPLVVKFCNIDDDELREYCIQAFESFVRRFVCAELVHRYTDGQITNSLASTRASRRLGSPEYVEANRILPKRMVVMKRSEHSNSWGEGDSVKL